MIFSIVMMWLLVSWAMYHTMTKHVMTIRTKGDKYAAIAFTVIAGPLMLVALIAALMLGRFIDYKALK
jgi:hypothetical protein